MLEQDGPKQAGPKLAEPKAKASKTAAKAVANKEAAASSWWVYLVLADDNSLYCGIAKDVERRFKEHMAIANKEKNARGAKYFYGRKPLKIVYRQACNNRSVASKREIEIKALPRKKKLELLAAAL